jgi:hypothetical protein
LAALARRPRAGGPTPVFVMLPLDTVDSTGTFRYGASPWFGRALQSLAASGVRGVAVDVWWGAVERAPRAYDWSGYRALVDALRPTGLRLQAVLAFHACGGNVGDDAAIPLPSWVTAAAARDPDLFYCAAPRPGTDCAGGGRNPEVLSLFADTAPGALEGRSPLEAYTDFMAAFADEFAAELWGEEGDGGDSSSSSSPPPLIEEVVVGAGPCGELRYPSYPEPFGWRFPGLGEFCCADRRALAALAAAASAAGHPEWGTGGPADAGDYNSDPEATPFFRGWGGGWATAYGRFFTAWWARCLVEHGERLAAAATAVFGESGGGSGGGGPPSLAGLSLAEPARPALSSAPPTPDRPRGGLGVDGTAVGTPPAAPALRVAPRSASLPEVLAAAAAATASPSRATTASAPPPPLPSTSTARPRPLRPPRLFTLAFKLAGVHWWYRTPAHAAEATAGYDNAGGSGSSYRALADVAARHGFALTLTCVEMSDAQHPPEALCGPEGLLRQVREVAAAVGVPLGGENALPIIFPGGGSVDARALARCAYNSDAWGPPLQEDARRRAALYAGVAPDGNGNGGSGGNGNGGGSGGGVSLPPLRAVTFLRLSPAMLEGDAAAAWAEFMAAMRGE